MVTLTDIRQKLFSSLSLRSSTIDMALMHDFCAELLSDIPAEQRSDLVEKLAKLRRASDLWHLRTAVFDVISRYHGESIAQERLRDLDKELRPYVGTIPRRR